MSSTNRSKSRDSHVADYYITPPQAIRDFQSRKSTDSIEYMHCIWEVGNKPNYTKLVII